MSHLSLGVLGPFQVSLADTPVTTFESDKVRALLAYLAVESDHPHRREELVGLLWPDYPEQAARHSLRQALSNLRQVIGDHNATPPYLLISREEIQFNCASDHWLDLTQFDRQFSTFDKNRNLGIEADPKQVAQLEEIVKLYRGEFLQQFFLEDSAEFEEWALVQRESLHQRVLDIHTYLADYYEQHRDYRAARRHASRQLELDPWREEAFRRMMRALVLDGQRSAALAQYEVCRRVLAEELDVEPSPETRDLYDQIRDGTFQINADQRPYIPSSAVHNLPVQLTAFIGREPELDYLGQQLRDPGCRCITLVGPGGIGKTRLALQVAGNHLNEFAHGVAFIPLASVRSVEAVIPAIANGINFAFYGPSDPKVQLFNCLREKQMLLILDNVEHLLVEGSLQGTIAELLIEILQQAAQVKLLVTSREGMNLQGEWLFEVQGLPFPTEEVTDGFDEFSAVALFIQRARRTQPGFMLDEEDRAGVASICRLVEGMPLAIELAATWVKTLSPTEIATEIEHDLDFLSASVRDLPERHRSVRAVFDHSWQMLSTDEQQVLCQLSVFQGGFQRRAAEQVAGASLSILSTLVNRTLLRRTSAGRYDLHDLVRQYAASKLAADPQAYTAAQKRHLDFYLALVETADQELKGHSQLEWLGRLEQDHDNLWAALEWALKSNSLSPGGDELALRLTGALRWYWRIRGHFHEGCDWLMKALRQSQGTHSAARASALLGMSLLMNGLGELGEALQQADESAAIYRELGDRRGLGEALTIGGLTLVWQGECALGCARLEEALTNYRSVGDRWGEAQALYRLGSALADYRGDLTGRDMLVESVAILEDLGEKYLPVSVLTSLGIVDAGLGNYAAARARFERSLAVAREIRNPWGIADALTNLGCLFRIQGDYLTAQSHLEAAHRVYQEHGRSIWEADVLCALAENNIVQGDFSTARRHLQAATNILGSSDNKWLQTLVWYFRGVLAYYEGDADGAYVLLGKATTLAREGQYKPDLARSLVASGRVSLLQGKVALATRLVCEGLDLYQELGHKLGVAVVLEALAAVKTAQDDNSYAVMLFGAAHALREQMGAPLPPVDRLAYDTVIAANRAQLGETAFTEAWAQAEAMPYGEIIKKHDSSRI